MNQSFFLEVIAFNIQSCIAIQEAGAHRIELCDNSMEGGTTPSYGFIKAARKYLSIELYPIIRPRGGDFLYSKDEFEIMKSDVLVCKKLGCDGVVIGILTAEGNINKERCKVLVDLAYPMGVTFHRAFDRVNNMQQALEDVIEIGCERILTSGLYPTAMEGIENLQALIKQADERIIIMPGSGIRSANILDIASKTTAVEFHTSARKIIDGQMKFRSHTMNENLQSVDVDEAEVKKIIALLHNT